MVHQVPAFQVLYVVFYYLLPLHTIHRTQLEVLSYFALIKIYVQNDYGAGLICDGKLAGIFSENGAIVMGEKFVAYNHFADVYRYKDWIEAQKSTAFMTQPKVFLVLTASIAYFIRFMF